MIKAWVCCRHISSCLLLRSPPPAVVWVLVALLSPATHFLLFHSQWKVCTSISSLHYSTLKQLVCVTSQPSLSSPVHLHACECVKIAYFGAPADTLSCRVMELNRISSAVSELIQVEHRLVSSVREYKNIQRPWQAFAFHMHTLHL